MTITSFLSNNELVAECRNLSISSFTLESFRYTYRLKAHKLQADNNHNKKQNIQQHC